MPQLPNKKISQKSIDVACGSSESDQDPHCFAQTQAKKEEIKKQNHQYALKKIEEVVKKQKTIHQKLDKNRQDYERQVTKKKKAKKIRNKEKNPVNQIDISIKKQSKRGSAAPPQLITDSSKSSSQKSEKISNSVQKAAPEQPKQSVKLYIGNLPSTLNENNLKKMVKKYGNFKSCLLSIHTTTGKVELSIFQSKGFGFVQYFQISSAIKAKQELSLHILDGHQIKIQYCTND